MLKEGLFDVAVLGELAQHGLPLQVLEARRDEEALADLAAELVGLDQLLNRCLQFHFVRFDSLSQRVERCGPRDPAHEPPNPGRLPP